MTHLIVKEAENINKELGNKNINAIPNSYEKFMSFSIGQLKFIDSFQFMASSLDKLVKNLYNENSSVKYDKFKLMKQEFGKKFKILCRKGHYPYEWMDDIEKFNYPGLPPKEAFYSTLSQEGISDEGYEHAKEVYDIFNCSKFEDYHMLYLKSDVLLLADVFENFRNTCMTYYKLDPANYLTAPGLAWDAMLLMTGIKLDLITDLSMLDMIEKMKRGGLCFVGSKRHVKANNKYLQDFDPKKPSNYILYLDANNLYGWAMSQLLPDKNLKFVENISLDDILATPDDNRIGFFVEVDLQYPRELHEKFKEFPPCPESLTPDIRWFSKYQREVGIKNKVLKENETYNGSDKLIPHLMEHEKYVIHYRNLKFIHELGVEITKVHRVISFEQKAWLKPYIDFNTEKRKEAKNEFEKEFFKLMNNAVFGKTMENVKNRMDLHRTTDHTNAVKWFSKLHFKDSKNIDGLHLIAM